MTCGPNTQISPTPFTGNSSPASSRMETSVEDTGRPTDPLNGSPMGLAVTMGDVSVNPQPWATLLPVASFQRFATADCSAIPPAKVARKALKSTLSKPGVCSNALNSVFTPLIKLNLYFFNSATNPGKSRGFVIKTLRAPKGMNARQLLVSAKMWYSGSAVMTIRPAPACSAGRIHTKDCSRFATMLRWVSTAALATPVVPPVYCRKAMSSGPRVTVANFRPSPIPKAFLNDIEPGILQGGTCLRT